MTDMLTREVPVVYEESQEGILPVGTHFLEDFFLFDMSDRGRMITGRAPAARLNQMPEYFFRYVTTDAWEEIRIFLSDYPREIMLIRTHEGVAILCADLMPAASLGIVVFPHLDGDTLLSLMNGRDTVLWNVDEPFPFSGVRRTKRQKKGIDDLSEIIRQCRSCLDVGDPKRESSVFQYVRDLSRWVGCPVHFLSSPEDPFPVEWDLPSFTTFLLGALCFCRRHVLGREMEVEVSWAREECTVVFRMSKNGLRILSESELEWLKNLADKKNMLFERTRTLTLLQLRVAPIRRDVAYLGLKKPPYRPKKKT